MPTDSSGPYVPPGEYRKVPWGVKAGGDTTGGLGLPCGACSEAPGGGLGGHSGVGPESIPKGVVWQQPPARVWPLLPHTKMLTCAPFSFPAGYYPPPGPHPPMGYYPAPGHYPSPSGHTATVLVPSGAATTVTVLQGEIFQGAPVQTVCPHCQQAITTKITYEIGLMSFLLGFFCCFVG